MTIDVTLGDIATIVTVAAAVIAYVVNNRAHSSSLALAIDRLSEAIKDLDRDFKELDHIQSAHAQEIAVLKERINNHSGPIRVKSLSPNPND